MKPGLKKDSLGQSGENDEKKKKWLRIKPTEKACTWGQKLEKEYLMQKPRIIKYHLAKQSFKNEIID